MVFEARETAALQKLPLIGENVARGDQFALKSSLAQLARVAESATVHKRGKFDHDARHRDQIGVVIGQIGIARQIQSGPRGPPGRVPGFQRILRRAYGGALRKIALIAFRRVHTPPP